jgi:hypothetical protein
MRPRARTVVASSPIPVTTENANHVLPLLLLVAALLVPATALALVAIPTGRLPERAELLLEERRETLVALGLMGAFGAAIGIAIALVEL